GAERQRRGQRLVGGILQRRVVMFSNQQRGHQRTPASVLSFATSSATSLTLTPPLRPGGSAVFKTSRCGVRSTPVSDAFFSAIGFFFAFMMLGSEAYRGSFSRRSVVTMAGPLSLTVCKPPSTSRVTLKSLPSTSSLEAKVACDQPSSAASIWPVWFESSSI